MGGSDSKHTERREGAPGAPGGIFMGISTLDKIQKGSLNLTTGKGGTDGKGEDTILKLSDGTVLGKGPGGGTAGTNLIDRDKYKDAEWTKYGKGGASDKTGEDGYGLIGIFTLKITKDGGDAGDAGGGTSTTPTPTP